MRQFAVIGLGNFGSRVARHLGKRGFPVIAIDMSPTRVEMIQSFVTQAIQIDATAPDALSKLGIGDLDAAVVSLGDDLESSVMVTMSLKEVGVKNIIVKGISREHSKILKLLGATQVVFPEEDAALRLARTITEPGILDHFSIVEGYSIIEIHSPYNFAGKTLAELNLRRRYGVECLAIKTVVDDKEQDFRVIPSPDQKLGVNDRLILLAPDDNLAKFREIHDKENQ
ncbi:MAG: potassium channel family protein [Candidatus Zixiibacteriota bacterium]